MDFRTGQQVRIRKGFGTKGLTGKIIGRKGSSYVVQTDQIAFARNVWTLKGGWLEPMKG